MKSKVCRVFIAITLLLYTHIAVAGGSMKSNLPEIQVNRDSVAFDADFNQIPANQGRYERICVASRPLVTTFYNTGSFSAWDVDGDFVLCSSPVYAYTTTDGSNFTLIADTNKSSEPFASHRTDNDAIKSIKVMDDGSWILCLGHNAEGAKGNLFRSTDKGSSWTWVMEFESGCVGDFGWYAVADNEVAIGEYGYRCQLNSPRRVYYSDDYGASWSKIYEPDPEPDPNKQHVHLVAFKPGDTNDLYVAYGDGEVAKVIKLRYTPGPGGKKDPNNWSETSNSPIYISNPTCGFSDGRYLYWGHDGCFTEPVVWRLDPVDDSTIRVLDWPSYVEDPNCPYRKGIPKGDVYSMCIYDGVYYAAVRAPSGYKMGGIYVSVDGERWVCAYRKQGVEAFHTIVGYASGYLWGSYYDYRRKLYRMEPVNAALVEALRVESGVTNIFDSSDESSFETSIGGWFLQMDVNMDVNTVSSGRTTEESLHGDSSLKVVCADKGYGLTRIQSNLWENLGGNPQVGDYVCVSFWIKGGPNWPNQYTFHTDISVVGGGSIDFYQSDGDDIMDEWQKITIWGKCVSDITGYIRLRIELYDCGYDGDFSDATCYIDGVQAVYSPDLHNSGSWQLGGVVRDNEYAWQSLAGIGSEFTSTFEWRPELSSREWHTDIPIASWTDDTNHIDLYYDKSVSRFLASDGVYTAMTANAYTWEHPDSIKLALTNTTSSFTLSVETPLTGAEHATSDGTVLGAPTEVKFGTDNEGLDYGCGLVTTVRHWTRSLEITEIERVWDIYGPVGDFTDDWFVDLQDMAVLAAHWLDDDCTVSEWCDGADLNKNGVVDWHDLEIFVADYFDGL